jgi:hypothetical protein
LAAFLRTTIEISIFPAGQLLNDVILSYFPSINKMVFNLNRLWNICRFFLVNHRWKFGLNVTMWLR